MSASDSRAAIGGGGSTVYINVNVPTTVDKGAVGREIIETILAAQREIGPVLVTTRS